MTPHIEAKKEDIANYAASVVGEKTYKKDILGVDVSYKGENSPFESPGAPDLEFYNMYGTFKEKNATFASGINFKKDFVSL